MTKPLVSPRNMCKLTFLSYIIVRAYGIVEDSTITIIGSRDRPPQSPEAAFNGAEVKSERACIITINNEIAAVNQKLRPSLDAFLEKRPRVQAEFDFEHRRLGELLLQSLLRLDALAPESHWSEARNQRKQAVKEIQTMLTKLDKAAQEDLNME
jgi:hypothetical protein